MTTHATTASAATAPRRYSEQIHALVERPVREVLVGLSILDAGNARPREGETIRDLLDFALRDLYEKDPKRYQAAGRKGRVALRQRDDARAADGK